MSLWSTLQHRLNLGWNFVLGSRSASSQESADTLNLLQQRISLFSFVCFVLPFVFWLVRVGVTLVHPFGPTIVESLLHPSMVFHFLASLPPLIEWLITRRGRYTKRFLYWSETISITAAVVFNLLMAHTIPIAAHPEIILVRGMTFGMIARAVIVPSSSRHTLAVSSICGMPIIAFAYLTYALRQAEVPYIPGLDQQPIAITIGEATWWLLTIIMSTFTSRVIYGLRKEIREARQLGQYVLEEKLGEGGMGEVYRAKHSMLRRPAAIKLLPPHKAGERTVARFEREVRLTSELTHPNTVTVFDYGRTPDGVFYYAMELLDGATLEQVVQLDGPQSPARVVHILSQVAGALAEAHSIGLIHRDIKPANIILCERGHIPDVAKVVDFGLVKELGAHPNDVALTAANQLTGTPLYMSPEAILSPSTQDGRSDLYAVGAVGYYLLTGQHVFEASTVVEVCGHHLHSRPVPPSERLGKEIPKPLEELILQCLEKDPKLRPQSADELQTRLATCIEGPGWSTALARLWWKQFGPQLKSRQASHTPSAYQKTLAVDWQQRSRPDFAPDSLR